MVVMTDKMKKKKKKKEENTPFSNSSFSESSEDWRVFCHNHKPSTTVIASRSPTAYYREDQELRNAK